MPETFEDACVSVGKELVDLIVSKQRDYGKGNILDFGEYGVLVRANDKMARLKNLILPTGETEPGNESIEDSWKDLANYAIIALLLRRGWFELPLKDNNEYRIRP